MGYYMEQREAVFTIANEDKKKALEAIKTLHGKVDQFSWVDENFYESSSLEEAMMCWRWELQIDEETDEITGIYFAGEKLGDDKLLFDTIAPFVEKDSYIEIQGEDGTLWRWIFDGKKCDEQAATIVWK